MTTFDIENWQSMTGNEKLRAELDTACGIVVPSEYRARLAELKQEFGHSIVILSDGAGKIRLFNCFAYAFGIWDNLRYERLVGQTQTSALMNSAFVMRKFSRGDMVEVAGDAIGRNDIVLYWAGAHIAHAGRIIGVCAEPTVHSKWGGNEVHEHRLWEVPLQHGGHVRYFRPPGVAAILDELEAEQR
jgi:hypothetical protein